MLAGFLRYSFQPGFFVEKHGSRPHKGHACHVKAAPRVGQRSRGTEHRQPTLAWSTMPSHQLWKSLGMR